MVSLLIVLGVRVPGTIVHGRLNLLLLLALTTVAGCARRVAPVPPADRTALLVEAVRSDSAAVVRRLLDGGVSPDTIAPDGTRPLTEAAHHGRLAAARVLLDDDARLDLADAAGLRPFDYVMDAGHRELAFLLTRAAAREAGANAGAMSWFDALGAHSGALIDWHRVLDGELTSLGLMAAVLAGRDDAVSSLRRAGGVPNRTGYLAIQVAARFGDVPALANLLAAGANPDAEVAGHRHETPLMEAARDGHVEVAERLLHAGARVDHVDSEGETALMWAVRAGETDYASALLAAGANPVLRNRAGETALDIAREIKHEDLINLLEAHPKRTGR
ncbi:MAG: ankyrin repeat domain-containing protein [Gemmatimonadales bacterium]